MMKHNRILLVGLALALVAGAVFGQSSTSGNQRQMPTYQLTITSNVRNADVYLNGELQRSTTPVTLGLRRGTYEIRIEARGYLPWSQTVVVNASANIYAELQLPYATLRLEVPSQYLNYDVRRPHSLITFYVDGEIRRGSQVQVPPGWHDVAIVSGGLRFENEVYVESGRTYSLEFMLRLAMLRSFQMVWQ